MRKIIIYGIIIFGVSILTGFYYGHLWKMNNPKEISQEKETNQNTVETLYDDEKVSYNASFALKKYYSKCGHFKFNYAELPKEVINLNKEELRRLYPDWNIEKFSGSEVVLAKDIDDMCDEHFVLKLGKDNIEVYKSLNNGKEKLYKSTNISKDYLTNIDIEKLEEGIYVYGISNLNSAIEDFE